jgi:anti-sigma factor RsiW
MMMRKHASIESLSRLAAGDLPPRRAARISAHMSICTVCTTHSRQLAAVPVILATVSFPPMPEYLCVKIETAIRVESATRVAEQPASEASRRDLPARSRGAGRWRLPKMSSPLALRLVAAAGAVVIVGGGGYEIASHAGGGAGSGSPSSAGGQAAEAAPAGGHVSQVSYGPNISYRAGGHTHIVETVATGGNFVPASFGKQSAAAMSDIKVTPSNTTAGLGATPTSSSSQDSNAKSAFTSLGRLVIHDLPRLRACVGLIAAGRDVLMVDLAKYLGQRATIIVVGNGSGKPPEAFAVGSRCSGTVKDILRDQLLPHL